MAKQTLFEAEAILSANTAGMLRDIDQAVQQAQARLNSLNGSVNFWNNRGGGGAGGGGGGNSNKAWNDYFKVEMSMARGEKAAGKFGDAINRLTALSKSSQNTALQTSQAYNALDAAIRASTKSANAAGGKSASAGGSGASSNLWNHYYKEEMTLVATARSAGKYEEALRRLNAMKRNSMYSDLQRLQVQKTIVDTENQGNKAREQYSKKGIAFEAKQTREATQATKQAAREAQNLANAQIRAAVAASQFDQAIQIQEAHLRTLTKGTVEYYNNAAKLQNLKNTLQSMGSPAARQRNAMIQNLSFGIQDFAVVASMGGGMGRAFAAASNNLSFMASMMGTTQGAILGLGLTLGAIALPAITRFALGLHDMGERAEEAGIRMDRMMARMKRLNDLAETLQKINKMEANTMSHAPEGQGIRDLRDRLKDEMDLTYSEDPRKSTRIKEAQDFSIDARGKAMDDFMWSIGSFAQNIPQWVEREIRSGNMTADRAREFRDQMPWDVRQAIGSQWQDLITRLESADAPLKDINERFKTLTEELKAANDALERQNQYEAAANAAIGQRHFGATNSSQNWVAQAQAADRQAAAAEEKKKRLAPLQLSATEGLFSQLFPKDDAKRKIKQQYAEAMYGITDPTTLAQMTAMRDFQMAQVDKQGRESIVGSMGGSEFASQLTNQLLKSNPMDKLAAEAAKHTGLQTSLVTKMDELINVTKTDVTTPFANN